LRMGEGRRRWSVAVWGRKVAQEAYGTFPDSMWNSDKGWEKAVDMPCCVTYVTEEHLIFVKWTLTYLTVDIIR